MKRMYNVFSLKIRSIPINLSGNLMVRAVYQSFSKKQESAIKIQALKAARSPTIQQIK